MNLFVYGTLTFPQIMKSLTGKDFNYQKAELPDHSVRKLIGKVYPGLIKCEGQIAMGFVLSGVDDDTIKLLTIWEGKEYSPTIVKPLVSGKEVPATAYTYIADGITNELWDSASFEASGYLEIYVNNRIPNYLKNKDHHR